jgi:hypothetical protein
MQGRWYEGRLLKTGIVEGAFPVDKEKECQDSYVVLEA